jgi:hypothetical protein
VNGNEGFGRILSRNWTYAPQISLGDLQNLCLGVSSSRGVEFSSDQGSRLQTMFVLSVTVQSATCERFFKEHKFIHTATKNQLENETTVAIIAIRDVLCLISFDINFFLSLEFVCCNRAWKKK